MELHEIQQDVPERVLLVSVDTGEFDCDVSLAELAELVATAGGEVVGTATQKKESPTRLPVWVAAAPRRLPCNARPRTSIWW